MADSVIPDSMIDAATRALYELDGFGAVGDARNILVAAGVPALLEALWAQWERNHHEQCDSIWPHPAGARCYWPPPAILGARPPESHPV